MKTKLLIAFLFLSLFNVYGGTLTASISTEYTSLEFNNDPNTNVGPDWAYLYVPSWVTTSVTMGNDELIVTGPGWHSASFDSNWNPISWSWQEGYSVQIVENIPLVYLYIGTTWYGNTVSFDEFLPMWYSMGGAYQPDSLPDTKKKSHGKVHNK